MAAGIKTLIIIIAVTMHTIFPTEYEETYLSFEIQKECIEVGEQYNICPELLMALIET